MPESIDHREPPARGEALIRHLRRTGPIGASEARRALGGSQPTFSRLVSALPERILQYGRARATRYAARRLIEGVRAPVPVYEIGAEGEPARRLCELHPVEPRGYVVLGGDVDGTWFEDLPWFLHDLRPAGFLGRLEGQRHRDLGLPVDILQWTDVHVMRYLVDFGWNLPGALVVGESAWRRYLEYAAAPLDIVDAAERGRAYPQRADGVLGFGVPGSSAGGEQPKFIAVRSGGGRLVPVLVKFTAPAGSPEVGRTADLLVAEHLAHGVVALHGHPAPASEVLVAEGRTFLEVERFDRQGVAFRRGVVSLLALDGAFVASDLSSWSGSTARLLEQGIIDRASHDRVRWLEAFGRLIANTDMHLANLSFLLDGTRVQGVAPVYDMLPMGYAVRAGQMSQAPFVPPVPGPEDADVWPDAVAAAVELWEVVAADGRVSEGFRAIAAANAVAVRERGALQDLLPRQRPTSRSGSR